MIERPKQLSRTTIYTSEWINLHVDKVELPGGRIVEKMHVVDYPKEAVVAIVVDSKGRILFEYSYRYHTNVDGWEIPAGAIDPGEDILAAAAREVQEETGHATTNHQLIYTYNPSNGSTNEVFHVVVCHAGKDSGEFDTNEVREVKWMTEKEVRKMIKDKEIKDGFSLTALLLYLGNFL